MPFVATTFAMNNLLWVGSYLAQLLFHAACERMTAEYPPATNGNLGREKAVPEPTRMMQDGSHLVKAIEAVKSEVIGWAASFSMAQLVGLGMG